MSQVEAIYESTELAEHAIAQLHDDVDVQEILLLRLPQTQTLPLRSTQARRGVAIGAGFGVVMGLIAGALVAWHVGDRMTASAAWMLGLGSMLLGALAGGLAGAMERRSGVPITNPATAIVWLSTSSKRLSRLIVRLHELGARRVVVFDRRDLPEVAALQR